MHVPNWLLAIVASYLTGRRMIIKYRGVSSSSRDLPGGFDQGTGLGGFLFLIKFNSACLRPPVPRPISGNKAMQVKFVDDVCQAASVNMRASLIPDTGPRPRPLQYCERTERFFQIKRTSSKAKLTIFKTLFSTTNWLQMPKNARQ